MKTYKTWEVVKMLSENPKLKFQLCDEFEDEYIICVNSFSAIIKADDKSVAVLGVDDEWALVQQPVTFMEAIKDYREGKTVRCEIEGDCFVRIYKNSFVGWVITDQNNLGLTTEEILEGKWYIQEVENE